VISQRPLELDAIDRAILKTLQQQARIQNNHLAGRVGISAPNCLRRVRQLENAGIIERYVALVDAAKVGIGLTLFVRGWLASHDQETVSTFVEEISRLLQVVECHLMAGDSDFFLKVVAKDLDRYQIFQSEHLARIKGVRSFKAEVLMKKMKNECEIPI
jgi:Lrp/AsnC family leucine-responsive transcriptional regulator